MRTDREATLADSAHRRVGVITGATSGIGRAVALNLAAQGVRLIVSGRDEHRGEALAAKIQRFHGPTAAEFIRADLTLFGEVEYLAMEVWRRFESIDLLLNNAGARFDRFGANPDGIERTFAGNHLGHFLLTALLLERLLRSTDGRVITLGSGAHGVTPPPGWILTEANYDRKLAYGSSKLANIVFAYELARRLKGTTVSVNAFDPGGVATRLGLNNGLKAWLKHIGYYLSKRQLITPRRAGLDLAHLCVAPELRGKTGGYFAGRQMIRSSTLSHDAGLSGELWRLSVEKAHLDAGRVGDAWTYFAPVPG